MKNLIPLLLSFSLFFACIPDEPNPRIIPEPCIIKTEVAAPEGFKIREMDLPEFNGTFQQIQFVRETVGYILASKNVGSKPAMFKTEDGGESWTELSFENDKYHRQMFFVDEMLGFITLHDTWGCPSNCLYRCLLLKTSDGGQSWEEVEISNLTGTMHHIQMDGHRNLYSNLYHDEGSTLIKSTDLGTSWDTLYDSPDLKIQLSTFSLELFKDKLFAPATDGRIIVLDTTGNLLQTLSPEQGSIWDVQVINEQTLVMAANQLLRSSDGGNSWTPIRQTRSRILHFFSPQKGLVIQSIDACPTDVVTLNDVIALTDDGGTNWFRSEVSTNLSQYFSSSQVMTDGRLMMLTMLGLYEIEEM